MEFDWMTAELPREIIARNAESRVAMAKDDVRLRASLLRRLGYDAAYAKHRLLGNQRWAYELVPGASGLSEKELMAEVDAAYAR